jgi:hypothetical protein
MSKTYSELITEINVIRNETEIGGNTKVRVANMFKDVVESTLATALPDADALTGDEIVSIIQDGESKQTTVQDIADLGSEGVGIQSVLAGTNITVDDTDPQNPIVNADAGPIQRANIDTAPGVILLDLQAAEEVFLSGSPDIDSVRTISLDNASNAKRFLFYFEISDLSAVLTFPGNFEMLSDSRWNSGAKTWTPAVTGFYEANASFVSNVIGWIMEITGAPAAGTNEVGFTDLGTGSGTLDLNFGGAWIMFFRGQTSFSTAKSITLSNDSNGYKFDFSFTIGSVAATLTFPSDFIGDTSDTRWNTALHRWTSDATGKFRVTGTFDGLEWFIEFTKAPYA